jgi:hypothetical protein
LRKHQQASTSFHKHEISFAHPPATQLDPTRPNSTQLDQNNVQPSFAPLLPCVFALNTGRVGPNRTKSDQIGPNRISESQHFKGLQSISKQSFGLPISAFQLFNVCSRKVFRRCRKLPEGAGSCRKVPEGAGRCDPCSHLPSIHQSTNPSFLLPGKSRVVLPCFHRDHNCSPP